MTAAPLRISVLGFGTVASGVIRILTDHAGRMTHRSGRAIDIRHVVVRDPARARRTELPAGVVKTDWRAAVNDPQVDVVVELMGGTTTARDAVLAAIAAGKHVVTANKALLCQYGHEIFPAARAKGVCVAFEAAVAGGIPIIAAVGTSLTGNRIESIDAILNGTSNFILSEMLGQRRSYGDALADAQALGYAEADPTMDVDGTDACQKLILLTQLAFGFRASVADVLRHGINSIELQDMLFAEDLGYRVKLLASARLSGRQLEMHVQPTLIRCERDIARTNGATNIVELRGDAVGRLILSGAGAGELPTASAVVADLVDVAIGRAQLTFPMLDLWEQNPDLSLMPSDQFERRYFLRFNVLDRPHVIADITDVLGRHGISLASVIQGETPEQPEDTAADPSVPLVIMTHRTTEGSLRAAEAELAQLAVISAPHIRMPVAD